MLAGNTAPRSLSVAWCAGIALALVALNGCVAMRRLKTPRNDLESLHPKVVRVTRQDGQRFIMIGAHLDVDTLMGFVQQTNGIHEFE